MPKVKKYNMKYIKYLFVTLLIIGNVVFSQEINNDEIKNNFGKLRAFDSTSKDLVGTSYIIEDFLPAKFVHLKGHVSLKSILVIVTTSYALNVHPDGFIICTLSPGRRVSFKYSKFYKILKAVQWAAFFCDIEE